MTRQLDWHGCANVRDLGGLPTAGGGWIRHGALVRADAVDKLTRAGWAALEAHGVRTIVDLRNDDELRDDAAPRPPGIETVHLPLDGLEDQEFWRRWLDSWEFGTPLYYGPHLERMPERSVAVLKAIAHARPGGVLFHCVGGRDRTGQIAMLALDLLEVPPGAIVEDYGFDGPTEGTARIDVAAVMATTLEHARARLFDAGLTGADVAALRARAL